MIKLSDEEWKLISDLINSNFGLVFQAARRGLLEQRLRTRIDHLKLSSFAEYYRYLARHPDRHNELRELPHIITNNETYFFRESHQFKVLTGSLLPELVPHLRSRPVRILSAGCSSGDEVYSIAISMQEDGTVAGWEIDACDLNSNRVTQAREGVYDASSLRACDETMRTNYFEAHNGRFLLRRKFRRGTQFFEGNLAAPTLPMPHAPYDVIFCRNVLIYFSERAFDAVITRFHRALADHGYLFFGHAESLIGRRDDFKPVRFQGSIVYQKQRRGAGA